MTGHSWASDTQGQVPCCRVLSPQRPGHVSRVTGLLPPPTQNPGVGDTPKGPAPHLGVPTTCQHAAAIASKPGQRKAVPLSMSPHPSRQARLDSWGPWPLSRDAVIAPRPGSGPPSHQPAHQPLPETSACLPSLSWTQWIRTPGSRSHAASPSEAEKPLQPRPPPPSNRGSHGRCEGPMRGGS